MWSKIKWDGCIPFAQNPALQVYEEFEEEE